jgi:acetyl-CoA carboxylase carboxyl transferase alpha subunit
VVPGHCPACGDHARVGARELLAWLAPEAQDVPVPGGRPDPLGWPEHDRLRDDAAARAGTDESVVVVRGRVGGTEAVLVAWEFGFLGGSMGSVAGARIAAAYDAAREAGLPIVLLPSTGGARMQEGMASLVQMAATTAAATRHGDAGLLQVTVLRDPTTGGVFASHANLSDVVWAEPGATIGFAGPRVAEAMNGGRLPSGSHTARGARAAGLVDDVVARPDLPARLGRLLAWPGTGTRDAMPQPAGERVPPADPWTQVQRARAADRVRTPQLLEALEVVAELRGDRAGDDDPSVRVVLARLGGRPVVVVGMDPAAGRVRPTGYRTAWRALELAARVRVPVVTLVDTPGADASAAAEAGGIAHHIARTLQRLLTVPTPVVALVVGEGGSGGALALAVGDRLLVQEHAIFSVIAPEGAAAILHRDASRAAEVAALLDPTATRLRELGIADEVVPEPVGGEVAAAWAAVARHLDEVDAPVDVGARIERWRRAGTVTGT